MSEQQQHDQESAPIASPDTLTVSRARIARGRRPGQTLTPAAREALQTAFLLSFAQTGNLTAAAMKVGVSRETVYAWQRTYKTFAQRYQAAEEQSWDVLRGEAFQRAVVGWDEYVVSMGKVVMDPVTGQPLRQRKKSDGLLQTMLKAKVPEYRERHELDVHGSLDHRHHVTLYMPQPELPPPDDETTAVESTAIVVDVQPEQPPSEE